MLLADKKKQSSEDQTFGAGVAKVELQDGIPTITQRFGDNGWWWDGKLTPRYGDVTAYRDVNSEYIYLLGGSPGEATDSSFNNIYQARVPAAQAFDLQAYEYWWGAEDGWKSDVLTRFDDSTAILYSVGQGQIAYNAYLKSYVFVHLSQFYLSIPILPINPRNDGDDDVEDSRRRRMLYTNLSSRRPWRRRRLPEDRSQPRGPVVRGRQGVYRRDNR